MAPGTPKVWDGKQWLEAKNGIKVKGSQKPYQLTAVAGWVWNGVQRLQVLEEACDYSLASAAGSTSSDGSGCSAGKCVRAVSWTTNVSNGLTDVHIRILRSVSGGSYIEQLDDQSVDRRCATADTCGDASFSWGGVGSGDGCYCDAGCNADGVSVQLRVRLETNGTDSLACGDSNNEKTTGTLSACGGGGA